MESNHDDLLAAQRAADRAEAAPWVEFPPTPAWYPVAFGTWAAALTATMAWLDGAWRTIAVFALVGLELAFIAWYRRYRGTMPSGWPPREFKRAVVVFTVLMTSCLVVVAALLLADLDWPAVVLAPVWVVPVVWWYEGAYARAAAAARARLG